MSNKPTELPESSEIEDALISEEVPNESSKSQIPDTKEKLKELIEPPLLRACEELYDKNIRTVSSSANVNNINEGYGYLVLEVSSMSPENLDIAKHIADEEGNEIGEFDDLECLIVRFPLTVASRVSEIEQSSLELASKFQKQPMTWAPVHTLYQLKEKYLEDSSRTEYDDPEIWIGMGLAYDPEKDVYYLSEEHMKKVKEFED